MCPTAKNPSNAADGKEQNKPSGLIELGFLFIIIGIASERKSPF